MSDYDRLLELMRLRRSIRRFSDRAVSRQDIGRLIEAARWAPSNHNRQPWRFLVVEDKQQ
jgi:nitroreductase